MPDVHTIWNSSTLGEGKKLGGSPSNRYSTNTFRRKAKAKNRYEKIKRGFCLLKQQYYNISNENVQLRGELEQSIISSKNLTTELERLKSQYIVMQTTASQHEASLITSKKEIDVLNLGLKELESALSSKITEIHTLESKLSSKTLELQKCEAELSSKLFELQNAKTKCGVYKQHVSDMTANPLFRETE
ncbi:unnamed protein product [Rhizophagus irregularis]|nr:unnamed protein product [Rhizophagus irregularis]